MRADRSASTSQDARQGRGEQRFEEHLAAVQRRCDRLVGVLLLLQWAAAVGLAAVAAPAGRAGAGRADLALALLGGAVLALPILRWLRRSDAPRATRHAVAASQMLFSALLIHLSGGRIASHFHLFGSLAVLASYREGRVLLTATAVAALDLVVRGSWWPASIFGVPGPQPWRVAEHALWIAFADVVLLAGIRWTRREMRASADGQAELEEARATVERRVEQRTRALAESREQFRELLETTHSIPWEIDLAARRFTYVGPQAERLLGIPQAEWIAPGFWDEFVVPEDRARTVAALCTAGGSRAAGEVEFRVARVDGGIAFVRSVVTPCAEGRRLRGVMLDVTERRQLELELHQAQKLESVGRLAAGVAHEINTPIQFVSDSVHFARGAMEDLAGLVRRYRGALAGALPEDAARGLREAEEAADLDYLLVNVPKSLDRCVDGLERVASIVRSMKEFAHPESKEMVGVDLNRAVRSTLTIARNEYKYVADVVTELGDLPAVTCLAGEVNQVLLNLVINAAHAIGEAVAGTPRRGTITIRTRRDGDAAVVSVGDDGCGIPDAVRPRIFEPFFTTKPVGRGTGQGLAIARSIVVDKHGGALTFESEVGRGTTFVMRLPVAGRTAELAGAVS